MWCVGLCACRDVANGQSLRHCVLQGVCVVMFSPITASVIAAV
jgi:hypothetical protein